MPGIRTQTSAADRLPLPYIWHMSSLKGDAIKLLQSNVSVSGMPTWWREMTYDQRCRVIRHLYAVGSLRSGSGHAECPPACRTWKDQESDVYIGTSVPINKGRMLGVAYTELSGMWKRGNGQYVDPTKMNSGHLENSIKLLNESHGNVVAKACMMLGAIHGMFKSVTGIREYTESLCIQLQKVDVSRIYPIFDVLVDELQKRQQIKHEPPIMATIDMFNSLMDQEIASWDQQ